MKILITGGAGFIGSAVIRSIMDKTNFEVLNIDKLTYAGNLNSLSGIGGTQRYVHEKVDICDRPALEKIFKRHKPSCVMHLAAETHVDQSITHPAKFLDTNVIGTFNLLSTAKDYYEDLSQTNKKLFRFHHISTDEVYGDLSFSDDYFSEITPYSPSSPYSASKAAADHLVRAWGRTYGLPVLITNCSNNYGPYQFPEKLIPNVILNAILGKTISIYGNGLQIRDWLFVEDHAAALIKVIVEGKIGETYNIGGHNQKTNLEVVESICQLLEELVPEKPPGISSYRDLIVHIEDRPGHDLRYAINASKIKSELMWMPLETFETGLHKTVKWYLENRNWWAKNFLDTCKFQNEVSI